MSYDTQPLAEVDQELSNVSPLLLERVHDMLTHVHGPFQCVMNQNHNALRWCVACGQAWVGVMAGVNESDLVWHPVGEIEEDDLS